MAQAAETHSVPFRSRSTATWRRGKRRRKVPHPTAHQVVLFTSFIQQVIFVTCKNVVLPSRVVVRVQTSCSSFLYFSHEECSSTQTHDSRTALPRSVSGHVSTHLQQEFQRQRVISDFFHTWLAALAVLVQYPIQASSSILLNLKSRLII